MVSPLYASLAALWLCWLTLNVVKERRKHQVKYGDGNVEALRIARSAHENATETIPIALILLFALELSGASPWLIHIFGAVFIVGRVIHGKGILADKLKNRALGMRITVFTIIALALSNMIFYVYGLMFA